MCLPFRHKWSPWQWRTSYRIFYNALTQLSYRDDGVLGEKICTHCFKHKKKFIPTPYPQQLLKTLESI